MTNTSRRALLAGATAAATALGTVAASAATDSHATDARLCDLAAQIADCYRRGRELASLMEPLREAHHRWWVANEHLSVTQRLDMTAGSAEAREYERLGAIQEDAILASGPLEAEMFDTPAVSDAGRMAKLRVLQNYIWSGSWTASDGDADYDVILTRKFLFDLMGFTAEAGADQLETDPV